MRLAQEKIRWLARLMLALVLFAQGVVAASACVATEVGPAQAYSMAQDGKAAACHEEEIPYGHGTDTTLIDETHHARLPHPNPPPEPEKLLGGHPGEGANEALHEFHDNANACLSHCSQSDQISADQHSAPVAPPAGIIGWASTRPPATDIRQLAAAEQIVPDTGPPLPIRFCSFLN